MRIYRQDRRTRRLVGVVEEAGVEEKRAFTTLEELWRILTASHSRGPGSSSPRPPRPTES